MSELPPLVMQRNLTIAFPSSLFLQSVRLVGLKRRLMGSIVSNLPPSLNTKKLSVYPLDEFLPVFVEIRRFVGGRGAWCVCVYWPPTGTGLSHDRRFNAQGRAPAQTAAARDTNSYPRYSPTTLVHVSELSPAEATAARNDGELPGSGEACSSSRLCLFPLALSPAVPRPPLKLRAKLGEMG